MKRSTIALDEKFTGIADRVSEGMGKWQVTAVSVVIVALWLAAGPFFHFSDTWQLMVNTPTTILEMWVGFLLAAAANRAEKRNRMLHENMLALVRKEERELKALSAPQRKGRAVNAKLRV